MDLTQFTPATWIGAVLAMLPTLGIILIGISYAIAPTAISRGFGFTSEITPEVTPWQHIKGPRDIVTGLLVIVILIGFGPAAAGVALLVETLIPIGDGVMILRNRGRVATAVGVHFATAALMIVAGVLLLV
ncbi:DUF4267 domain-containing protein [Agromyces larvae]|uniref:DUF4267 domain-containing protein n=1 Tax=Agromyces larvae TaxID=2929802 RepID=A0ABY4BVQ4_9MICO|nr:DUF4267 domain-containing protein [Agromyces larvae]UOE43296.1 DUF4267 domain-containing protein [Agromyces larvae]